VSNITELADEFEALAPNTAIRLTREAQRVIVASLRMVERVDEVMAVIGCHGEISAKDDRVSAVMDCLHRIDPQ
jgi:hypothetical protein